MCFNLQTPPKRISGFIQEFSDLSSVIMLQYDRVLILGDFNMHVCCPSSSDSMNLLDSFRFSHHQLLFVYMCFLLLF